MEDKALQYHIRELTPGATYQVQAYTVYDNKESVAYTSRNFTTSKFYLNMGYFYHFVFNYVYVN